MAWGLGYFGQPHIIVRFMAIKTIKETKSARRIGMSWMIITLIGTIFTGINWNCLLPSESTTCIRES